MHRRNGAHRHGADKRHQVGDQSGRRWEASVLAHVSGRLGVLQLRPVRPGEPSGEREEPARGVRLRRGGRRLGGRGGCQPAVREPGMERAAAGGRRPRVGDHGRAGHIAVPARQQIRLEVQDAAGAVGVPGDEGTPLLLDPGQGDRRLQRAEHHAVRAGQPAGLRQLGPTR